MEVLQDKIFLAFQNFKLVGGDFMSSVDRRLKCRRRLLVNRCRCLYDVIVVVDVVVGVVVKTVETLRSRGATGNSSTGTSNRDLSSIKTEAKEGCFNDWLSSLLSPSS